MAADHEVASRSCGEILGTLDRVTVSFGLEAQGHIPIIERMLGEGATWKEISQSIGWDPEAAAQHYFWHLQRIVREQPIRLARIFDLAVLMLLPGGSSGDSPQPASEAPCPGDQNYG